MEGNNIISIQGVRKKYGSHRVLEQIDLDIPKGDIFGLVGKNGSGKTTLFKVLLGLSPYEEGRILIGGKPQREGIKQTNIGFMVGVSLFPYMNAKENLQFFCEMKGIPNAKAEIDRTLSLVGLQGVKTKAKGFSLGMRQRLCIANAMLGNPEVIILDEPTNGLDPQGIADIRHLIQKINQEFGTTIIVSSHILGELQNTAHRFGILNEGKVVRVISQEELQVSEDLLTIRVEDQERARAVLEEAGIAILETKQQSRSLEDYYFSLIGGEA